MYDVDVVVISILITVLCTLDRVTRCSESISAVTASVYNPMKVELYVDERVFDTF